MNFIFVSNKMWYFFDLKSDAFSDVIDSCKDNTSAPISAQKKSNMKFIFVSKNVESGTSGTSWCWTEF